MTLKQLREACSKPNHGLAGFYNGGELYINNSKGRTIYQKYMDRDLAEDLCNDLGLTLEFI